MREQAFPHSPAGSSLLPYSYRHVPEKIWLPLVARNTMLAVFILLLLCIGAFFSITLPDSSVFNKSELNSARTIDNKTRNPDNFIMPEEPKTRNPDNFIMPEQPRTRNPDNFIMPEQPRTRNPDNFIMPEQPRTRNPDNFIMPDKPKTRNPDNFVMPEKPLKQTNKVEFPLKCSGEDMRTCPANYYPAKFSAENPIPPSTPSEQKCPDYFRYIHEDLRPWSETGITKDMVDMASKTANFKLVILNGTAYVETYEKAFQTRDTYTLWGLLQLLRRYPGQIPDLELMFDCVDWPVIKKEDYNSPNVSSPPPLFRYCADDATYDIVFPDWSFWGWPETNIKPWEHLSKDIREGNKRSRWVDREPHAYWKGNPNVAETRMDLLNCNVSDTQDWNARIYVQDWAKEHEQGYKQSDLANQCNHRYKIYIEGSAWSVSQKYILACDSVPLIIDPKYYDFFSRGLMPLQHYWPIKVDDKCRSIKHAVDWGNSNVEKAQAIGKASSSFILDELDMDYVYDYMFHLLSEYAKLLKYQPSVPENAVELCSESVACPAQGVEQKFMMDSTVKVPRSETPCAMPPPYDPATRNSIVRRKESSMKQVETWKNQYWD